MEDKSLRKRQQIAKANKMMFLWVAGTSVIVGFAVVGAVFLGQKLLFNEKVLAEKSNTISTLRASTDAIDELKRNVRLLDTNQGLIDSRAKDDDRAIRVILDALPADANSLAFGSSLQQVLLADIPGLSIEDGMQVQSMDDPNFDASEYVEDASSDSAGEAGQRMGFRFTVNGSPEVLTEVLRRLEKSIRAINLTSIEVESQNNRLSMSVVGHTFYEPERTVELREKAVRP
jgi:hypothetical protein